MNVNELNIRKTALLFFDMLNIYYHGASQETKRRMKPVVDNAVRLMNAARQNRMLIYYADGESPTRRRESEPAGYGHRYAPTPVAE
jgi:nicotinamidase-related amidase